ncbi:MAG: hypothetical protein PHR98_01360 [Candidatus Shapirobacteria bacterium]|jgi:hypothetical protein|nr:hypothetical protein [Candidatus Shapirobacteria bacterium]
MRNQIEAIIEFSRLAKTDWQKIDSYIQRLSKLNPNAAAKFVLPFSDDSNPRVRDTTAKILEVLDLENSPIVSQVTDKMISQTTNDEDIFASGRAATFLLKHKENPFLKEDINPALESFNRKVIEKGWQKELIENIPNNSLHQLLIKSK